MTLILRAAQLNLELPQGSTFDETITVTDKNGAVIDLTGYSARMKIRTPQYTSSPEVNWTSAGGEMIMGDDAGTITFDVSAATTAALDFKTARYDLEIESGSGKVTRILEGYITLSREVTYS